MVVNKRIRHVGHEEIAFGAGVSWFDKQHFACYILYRHLCKLQLQPVEFKYAGNSNEKWKKEKEVLDWFSFFHFSVWKGHFDQCCIIGTVLGSYRVVLLFNDEILNIGLVRLQSLAGSFVYSPLINLNLTPRPMLSSVQTLKHSLPKPQALCQLDPLTYTYTSLC